MAAKDFHTHVIAHAAVTKLENTNAIPTPLTTVACIRVKSGSIPRSRGSSSYMGDRTFVSGFLAITSRMQYPIWHTYIAAKYAAIKGVYGDIEAGNHLTTSPIAQIRSMSLYEGEIIRSDAPSDGETTRAHIITDAMLISSDKGVKTCSLH